MTSELKWRVFKHLSSVQLDFKLHCFKIGLAFFSPVLTCPFSPTSCTSLLTSLQHPSDVHSSHTYCNTYSCHLTIATSAVHAPCFMCLSLFTQLTITTCAPLLAEARATIMFPVCSHSRYPILGVLTSVLFSGNQIAKHAVNFSFTRWSFVLGSSKKWIIWESVLTGLFAYFPPYPFWSFSVSRNVIMWELFLWIRM